MQLYFIGEEHLVILTVEQPLAEVEANIDDLRRYSYYNHSCVIEHKKIFKIFFPIV